MIRVQAKITGIEEAVQSFSRLKNGLRNKILRKSTSTASVPQNKAVKQTTNFKDRSGLLRKSIGVKSRTYRTTSTTVSVVGPRFGYDGFWEGEYVNPINYSHLVEFGHGGPRPAGPKNFLRDAFNSSRGEAEIRFANKFGAEVVAEARKAGMP